MPHAKAAKAASQCRIPNLTTRTELHRDTRSVECGAQLPAHQAENSRFTGMPSPVAHSLREPDSEVIPVPFFGKRVSEPLRPGGEVLEGRARSTLQLQRFLFLPGPVPIPAGFLPGFLPG
jgi:hypothetical protein